MDTLRVLVVDDDPALRRALVRLLSRDERLRLEEAGDGLAALRIMEREPVDIVVTDEVMPEVNGIRLLETVRARWPGTRRVLYTGHPDAELVMDAVNRGGVHKALSKGAPLDQVRLELQDLIAEARAAQLQPASPIQPVREPDADQSPERPARIVLVASQLALRTALEATLRSQGFTVRPVADPERAEPALREGCDVAVLDLSEGAGVDVRAFLRQLRAVDLDCPLIVTVSRGDVERANQALRYGAYRYLVHPLRTDALVQLVHRAAIIGRVAKLRRDAQSAAAQGAWQLGDRAALEVRFRKAIEELFVVYQPIVSWSERRIIGYEALVRSREPALPHPGALFDAAERLDRVAELGRAIRRIAPEPLRGGGEPWLFLNLHVRDLLEEDLLEEHLTSMSDRIVLEITERAALDAVAGAPARVAELRARGFRIAVDDLGAGYAGLSSFATLEPDVVKLDMSLVRDIHQAPVKQRLVAGLRDACRDLDVAMVAEGVETVEERDCLVDAGCDLFQGFLFARPGAAFPGVNWS